MYAQKSFKDRLTSFDVYKKLPKGYLQPTCIGAICKIKYFNYSLIQYSNCYNNINVNLFIHVRI